MNTRKILLQLLNKIKNNEDIIETIPCEDIVNCVYIELYALRQLYDKDHFDLLEKELELFLQELKYAVEQRDVDSLCEVLSNIIKFQNTLPDNGIALDFIENANFNEALLRHKKDNTIIVLGDSHVNFFSGNEELSFLPIGNNVNTCKQINGLPITVLHLGPCLAYKSDSYYSHTQFRKKLDWLINSFISPRSEIICVLGEIDIRSHLFKQCEIQKRDYKKIIDDIVSHYISFLSWLSSQGFKVYVWGPIASQPDICPLTPNYPRVGEETERNRGTEYFIKLLNSRCSTMSIECISIFDYMTTDEYKTNIEYISSDYCHLGQRAFPKALELLKEKTSLGERLS